MNMTDPKVLRAERYGSPTDEDIPEPEFQCESCNDLHTKLYKCDFCRREICIVCYVGADEEVRGGLNVRNTGWDCCYRCAEIKGNQVAILTEAIRLAFGQVQRTGYAKDLTVYMNLRRELQRLERLK